MNLVQRRRAKTSPSEKQKQEAEARRVIAVAVSTAERKLAREASEVIEDMTEALHEASEASTMVYRQEDQILPPEQRKGALPDGKRVFVSTDHDTHWPVGGASVVIALNEPQARGLLDAELQAHGLNPVKGYTLKEIGQDSPVAIVLNDGEY